MLQARLLPQCCVCVLVINLSIIGIFHIIHLTCATTETQRHRLMTRQSVRFMQVGIAISKCKFSHRNCCIYCMYDILRTKHHTIARETRIATTHYSERYGVSNRRQLDCRFNSLFRLTVKENTEILRYRFH